MGQLLPPLPPKAYQEIKIEPPGKVVSLNVGDLAVSGDGMLIRWDGEFWRFVIAGSAFVRASYARNRPPITEFSVRKLELET
jgi:hypothetical protein